MKTLFALCAACGMSFAQILHVDVDAAPGGDGSSWANALNDLGLALDVAAIDPGAVDAIWIAEGTYTPDRGTLDETLTFDLVKTVRLLGGFDGTETLESERDWVAHETIISGDLLGDDGPDFANFEDNTRQLFTFMPSGLGARWAELDGFTIRGGYGGGGAEASGVYASQGSIRMYNCLVTENGSRFARVVSATLTVEDCIFDRNLGVVLHPASTTTWVTRCSFTNNAQGRPIDKQNSNLTIHECDFVNNSDAIAATGSGPVSITSCTFIDNGIDNEEHIVRAGSADDPTLIEDCLFQNSLGGALMVSGMDITVRDCVFQEGESSERGAAILAPDADRPVLIDNCVFEDFWSYSNGGAVFLGSGTLSNCTFRRNLTSRDGGGAWVARADVIGCLFEENSAPSGDGGGCHAYSDVTIDRSTFRGNDAKKGGGMATDPPVDGAVEILNCNVMDNLLGEAHGISGAGIHIDGDGPTRLRDCRIEGNQALAGGAGGVKAGDGTVLVRCSIRDNWSRDGVGGISGIDYRMVNCDVIGNSTDMGAGGVSGVTPRLFNCLVLANEAQGEAGGLFAGSGAEIVNTTIVGNVSGERGGGISTESYLFFVMVNSVVWGNTDSTGSTESAQIFEADPGVPFDLDHNIVEHWSGALGGTNNSGGDPMFLDEIGDDGVPWSGDEDVRPGAGSAAIDTGDDNRLPVDEFDVDDDGNRFEFLPIDLDGNERSIDGDGDSIATVDRGCFEAPERCDADLNGDTIIDIFDVFEFLALFEGGGPGADWNGDTITDIFDVFAFLESFELGC